MKCLCSIPRATNVYTAKSYLSAFEFIRTDLLRLYEKNPGSTSTAELQKAMNTLKEQQIFLNKRMDDWEYQTDFHNPNQWEKPCLEGIPKEHKWWNKELGIKSDNESENEAGSDSN